MEDGDKIVNIIYWEKVVQHGYKLVNTIFWEKVVESGDKIVNTIFWDKVVKDGDKIEILASRWWWSGAIFCRYICTMMWL